MHVPTWLEIKETTENANNFLCDVFNSQKKKKKKNQHTKILLNVA